MSQKLYLILINALDKMNQQDQMNESPITCIEIESFINHFEVNLVARIQEEATEQISGEEEDMSEWTHVGFRQDISNLQKDSNWEIKEILLICFAGLIRGPVSVALSFQFTDENQKLRCIVLLISLFTSIFVTTFSRDVIENLRLKNIDTGAGQGGLGLGRGGFLLE